MSMLQPLSLSEIAAYAQPHGLMVMGHATDGEATRVLIGANTGFWQYFSTSPEALDSAMHPIDRWSKRIIGGIAAEFSAQALFPSDGPPYAPFIAWAQATGRFHQSPTGMLVHDEAGLMISIRGALIFAPTRLVDAPTVTQASPCDSCSERPCEGACPVGALSAEAPYDVPACKAFLDTDAGGDCMAHGCATRRACPISQSFNRSDAQSAFHMRAFHRPQA